MLLCNALVRASTCSSDVKAMHPRPHPTQTQADNALLSERLAQLQRKYAEASSDLAALRSTPQARVVAESKEVCDGTGMRTGRGCSELEDIAAHRRACLHVHPPCAQTHS